MPNPLPALCSVLAVVSSALCVVTATMPQWLERFFGINSDAGDGFAEWGLTLSLFIAAASFATLATRTWRRTSLVQTR